jgi:hypothetical protein
MTDTPTPGGRLDAAIAAAQDALTELRATLADKAAEIGAEINAKVDAIQSAIDEIQAARAEPDNTLPGE